MAKTSNRHTRASIGGWVLGIAIGLIFGVAIGSAIDNVGAGIAIGIGPRWVLGLVFSQAIRNAP
jgi:ABC-type dipeptide/oligopeptide/nickel transport system permease component